MPRDPQRVSTLRGHFLAEERREHVQMDWGCIGRVHHEFFRRLLSHWLLISTGWVPCAEPIHPPAL